MEPRLISVAIFDRGNYSRGHMRHVFGYEAYHWGLLVGPETPVAADCWTFEATDANTIDPVTFRMTNPAMEWQYKFKDETDPYESGRILGRVVIGVVPRDMLYTGLGELLGTVPLPERNKEPQESCVTWAEKAIKLLQERGIVPDFDLQVFKDRVMEYGDDRIRRQEASEPDVKYYNV